MKYWRFVCFALMVCGLHIVAARSRDDSDQSSLTVEMIREFVPQAATITHSGSPPVWEVRNASDNPIALACLTAPQADQIVGYAGPNNILLIMDLQGRVTQTHWLRWLDTQDHVEKVRLADSFWNQFQGRQLGGSDRTEVDGVSGATLTSLAIAEAIELRLSGTRPSLRFPQTLTLEEVQGLYPDAASLADELHQRGLIKAIDANEQVIGRVLRTGPLVDNQIGYQGPTELLVALDHDDRVTKVKLRTSFDNEPYVRYTRMEASFWAKFVGRTLAEISRLDLAAEGVEGVSGATMTSMAAAETLRVAAERHLKEFEQTSGTRQAARRWNWSLGEIATGIVALLLVPWSLSRLRGNSRWRLAWQVLILLAVVGVSGNLISMALLAGWTRSWPPVTIAPGLALLVTVSIIMPALFGRNVYCDHVCPHGIVQQWLARWRRRKSVDVEPLVQLQLRPAPATGSTHASRHSNPRSRWRVVVHRALHASSCVVLLLSISWIVWTIPQQLTFFEPFDVYAWRIGWSVSLGVWVLSLLLASLEPMGYCRFACPTGKLLDGIRRKRTGQRWQTGDMLLVALTVVVLLLGCAKLIGLGEIT